MKEEELKQINIRMPEEDYYQMKEVVLHLRTDMTAFINGLVREEVLRVLAKRDKENTKG